MLSLFESVKPFVKSKPKGDVPKPDSFVASLHYRATVAVLMVCCIIVSTYNFIDKTENPIQCLFDPIPNIEADVINRFCWITSTFTLPSKRTGIPGQDHIYPGVASHNKDDAKEYHSYYQWVPLVLGLQAVMFYAPHFLWKLLEGGDMKRTINGLKHEIDSLNIAGSQFKRDQHDDESQKKESETEKIYKSKLDDLANFLHFRSTNNVGKRTWTIYVFTIESLHFLHVILQMVVINSFLGGEFMTYGTDVLNFPYLDPEDRVDPMSKIFPRMTKCLFHYFGASGTVQRIDSLCVLSMNIVNEKVYIFLWFWFIFLAVASAIELARKLYKHFERNQNKFIDKLSSEGYIVTQKLKNSMEFLQRRLSTADWLVLFYLAQSLEHLVFEDLATLLASKLRGESEPEPRGADKSEEKNLLPTRV